MKHVIHTGVFIGHSGELLQVSRDYLGHLLPTRDEIVFQIIRSGCAGIVLALTITIPVTLATHMQWPIIAMVVVAPVAIWAHMRYRFLRNERLNWLRSVEARSVVAERVE